MNICHFQETDIKVGKQSKKYYQCLDNRMLFTAKEFKRIRERGDVPDKTKLIARRRFMNVKDIVRKAEREGRVRRQDTFTIPQIF